MASANALSGSETPAVLSRVVVFALCPAQKVACMSSVDCGVDHTVNAELQLVIDPAAPVGCFRNVV
jgi:hypothetical protein